ncbi:hypothetical protein VP1G_07054 [Cytospora mali]|uniref:CDP-alcohol phosphatidyltransferase class-I family protein C22A12.08c n=1 Tax=Cytospora mali TaxID=578113 RepID=A0A194V7P0_CYTMA|nr:hypothetical protein VP1G_07054 [Valsa mali var. pyri (nom. inval.)]
MANGTVHNDNCLPGGLHLERLSLQDKQPRARAIADLQKAPHDFAFAFDIDGVLVRGKVPIPGAKQALETLQANSIPFILLTNGGGLTEAGHAERVGQRLTMQIDDDQFVQSHTPFKLFLEQYKDEWILVLGGHRHTVKELAAMYGFKKDRIITTSDVTKHHPSIHPFPWATPHAIPRLAQGGFRAALEGVWAASTKGKAKLEFWTCGKPTTTTYEYAEKILEKYYRKNNPDPKNTIKTVYMIGDNPESDICGALLADENSHLIWRSCLVETGVHKSGTEPAYTPTKTLSGVWEAVRWVIEKECKVDIGALQNN